MVERLDLGAASEPSTLDESRLVELARDGDGNAFSELVRRYQRRAVSLAYRLLGNIEDASDVSQDAFVRAYRRLEQLDDPSRFGPWLLRVVSNLSLNYRRARRGKRPLPLEGGPPGTDGGGQQLVDSLANGHRGREAESASRELHRAITEAMERLPDKQRLALVLFSVEGMPQKQVADILDCSVELVKWNVFQARRKLKEALREHL